MEIQNALMQIGELAEKTGLSLRTIRHYDDERLLNPTTRSPGGFRLYSPEDLERLLVIRRMKPLGFSIDQMRELLDIIHQLSKPDHDSAALQQRLKSLTDEARERRERLHSQLAMADEFVALLEQISPHASGPDLRAELPSLP